MMKWWKGSNLPEIRSLWVEMLGEGYLEEDNREIACN